MSLKILYAGAPEKTDDWMAALKDALDRRSIDCELMSDTDDPSAISYVVYAPSNDLQDFSPFTGLKAVLSLWAGVDTIIANKTLTAPITRMADTGLRDGMIEYVTGHVLRYHLGMDTHIKHTGPEWFGERLPPLASKRQVGILGFGALGQACGEALARLNFSVTGWSRTEKSHPQINTCWGEDGLEKTLSQSDILVLLLPNTAETDDLMNARIFEKMHDNCAVINAGRGNVINEQDLVDALDQGQIGHATLDVFKTEPLPPDHPFWAHPKITVTPHVASCTRIDTATAFIAENIERNESGQPLLAEADRILGY